MSTPASDDAATFLDRVFPGTDDDPSEPDRRSGEPDDVARPVRGVDAARQRLLEPFGSDDRESW